MQRWNDGSFSATLLLPRRTGVPMATSPGKRIKYFQVQLDFHGMCKKVLAPLTPALCKWPLYCTDISEIRWEGFSLSACSLLNRMSFAIGDAVAHPQLEPGKAAEHRLSTRTECLTAWVMVTIWEQAVTYVDQHLSCPNWWLGSEPLGPQRGQRVPSLAGCRVGSAANLSNASLLILELSKKRQLPGTSSAYRTEATIGTAINSV